VRRMSCSASEVVRTTTGMRLSWSSPFISASTSRPSFLRHIQVEQDDIRARRIAVLAFPAEKAIASTPSDTTLRLLRTFALAQRFPGQPDVARIVFNQQNLDGSGSSGRRQHVRHLWSGMEK
jgi:hypothetical protein